MPRPKQKPTSAATGTVRRGGGLRRVPDMLTRVLDPAARRRGLAGAGILTDWPAIVGPAMAARCQPVKLAHDRSGAGGVLHLRVSGAAALELQHAAPQLVERINTHFGYPAVERLRLVQAAPLRPLKPPARTVPPLSADQQARIETLVQEVSDPALRAALAGLGRALHRHAVGTAGTVQPGLSRHS